MSAMRARYIIVWGDMQNELGFESLVSKYIKEGYEPIGALTIFAGGPVLRMAQPMWLPDRVKITCETPPSDLRV